MFRRSVDRIRLIQEASIPADFASLIVDVPKDCGQDQANTDALYACRLDRSYGWVPLECGQDQANTGALYTCRLDRSYS